LDLSCHREGGKEKLNAFPLILLAFAVSLDGFGAGIAYGLRKLRLPFISLITIGLTSGGAVFVTMQAGYNLGSILPPHITRWLGTIILVLVGLWVIVTTMRSKNEQNKVEVPLKLSVRAFGFIIQVIKEPVRADLDHSGEISISEAVLLGFALALDAIGAGFGAALAGFSWVWTPLLVALCKIILVSLGVVLGNKCFDLDGRAAYLSGCILILLGLGNLF
jgi:putative sporulation protein YtaF